ncbi:MAG: M2 family metallopeptidase, partial [Acidobacteriota bacterium]
MKLAKTRSPLGALFLASLLLGCALLGCAQASDAPPSAEAASEFVTDAEAKLLESWINRSRNSWVQSNFITDDTELLAAVASQKTTELSVDLAQKAARFDGLDLSDDLERKLGKIKLALTLPAPANSEETAELTQIAVSMKSTYGKGKYCPEGGECRDLGELSQ